MTTIAVATAMRPVGLAEVLLLVLVEVVVVSLFAGRTMTAATAVGAVLAVNWFLVPPYGTFQIQAQENWVSLAVFLLLAVGVSTLVEVVLGSERAAAAATAREAVMAEVLRPDSASAPDSLRAFRSALDLDDAVLLAPTTGDVLLSSARDDASRLVSDAVIDVEVAPGFRVVGHGAEIIGVNRDFADTLATAVVRAWESQELVAEQERSARLAEIDRARATLLASIGHDLRTPLAGIRVSADALLMTEGSLSDADRAELLDGLRQSAIRLDEVLGALLDSSRIEAGVLQVDKRPGRPRGGGFSGCGRVDLAPDLPCPCRASDRRRDGCGTPRTHPREPGRQRPDPHPSGVPGRGRRGGGCPRSVRAGDRSWSRARRRLG